MSLLLHRFLGKFVPQFCLDSLLVLLLELSLGSDPLLAIVMLGLTQIRIQFGKFRRLLLIVLLLCYILEIVALKAQLTCQRIQLDLVIAFRIVPPHLLQHSMRNTLTSIQVFFLSVFQSLQTVVGSELFDKDIFLFALTAVVLEDSARGPLMLRLG